MAVTAQKEEGEEEGVNWTRVAEEAQLKSAKDAMSEFMKLTADDLRKSLKFHKLSLKKPANELP